MSDTLRRRHCRCCGAEVGHDGWLDVCNKPECVRRGTREHAQKKHLGIFPCSTCYGVGLCNIDLDSRIIRMQAVYFGTELQAKEFVARVRAGMPKDELAALIEAHKLPPERITIEELRRRAADE
jgi:hypothetical protein